ncbi:hypothetical protein, partial [Parabacteroides distasonis]
KGRCQIFDQSKDGHIQEKQMTLEDGKMTIHQRISLQHYLHITNLRIKQRKFVERRTADVLSREAIKQAMEESFF